MKMRLNATPPPRFDPSSDHSPPNATHLSPRPFLAPGIRPVVKKTTLTAHSPFSPPRVGPVAPGRLTQCHLPARSVPTCDASTTHHPSRTTAHRFHRGPAPHTSPGGSSRTPRPLRLSRAEMHPFCLRPTHSMAPCESHECSTDGFLQPRQRKEKSRCRSPVRGKAPAERPRGGQQRVQKRAAQRIRLQRGQSFKANNRRKNRQRARESR